MKLPKDLRNLGAASNNKSARKPGAKSGTHTSDGNVFNLLFNF